MPSLLQHFLFLAGTGDVICPEWLESSANESRYAQVRLGRPRYIAWGNFRIFSIERIAVLVILFAGLKVAEANGNPLKMNLRQPRNPVPVLSQSLTFKKSFGPMSFPINDAVPIGAIQNHLVSIEFPGASSPDLSFSAAFKPKNC